MTAVEFKNVDIVFGEREAEGLKMLDQGASRSEILAKTGAVLGCAGASLAIKEGEISVLMGLSGSGKSTLLRCLNRLEEPSAGSIVVDGTELTGDLKKIDEVRREVAAGSIGLYRADSEAELDDLLGALPLAGWLRVAVTPLEEHANDPATASR